MRTATVYVAIDGRQFNDPKLCQDVGDRLFAAWLKENPSYADFINADVDDKLRRRDVFREFWEWSYGK